MTPNDEDKTWQSGSYEPQDDATWLPDDTLVPRGNPSTPEPKETFAPYDPAVHVDPAPSGRGSARDAREPTVAPTVTDAALPTKLIAGRFELLELLGQGGMGSVYRVKDHQIEGRELALKLLLPRYSNDRRFRDLFIQEIRASQKFVSENVIQVRDTGRTSEGQLFLTMDLLEGESLGQLLKREDQLQVRHALEVARQILLGLQSGHEHGFIHRDVKPSNVMLAARVAKTDDNPFGVAVKLLDFGIAGVVAEMDEGKVAGTPMYMSPEQIGGERLDPRSDLFAVGIVLYELLSGRRPFEGTTLQEIQTSVLETNLAPMIAEIEDLRRPERKILKKALEKDREKRFASATEFISAIERSRSFKAGTSTSAWATAGVALLGAAAAAEGAYIGKQYIDLGDKKQEVADVRQREESLRAQLAISRDEIKQLGSDLEEAKDLATSQTTGENIELAELRNNFKLQEVALQSAQDDLKSESDRSEQRLKENNRLQKLLDEANTRLATAQQQIAADRSRSDPELATAHGFDKLLRDLERENGSGAAARLDRLKNEQIFDAPNFNGSNLVTALVKAAAARTRYTESEDPDELELVADALEAARGEWPEFSARAESWLAQPDEAGDEVDRQARTLAELTRLEDWVAAERQAAVDAQQKKWDELRAASAYEDPTDAITLYRHTQNELELGRIVDKFSEFCDSQLIVEGRLNQQELRPVAALDAWFEFFNSNSSNMFSHANAGQIKDLALARRFYHGPEEKYLSLYNQLPPADLQSSGAHASWVDELRLKAAALRVEGGVPAWQRGERLFAIRLNGSLTGWKLVKSASGAGEDTWTVTEKAFKANGWQDTSKVAKYARNGRVIERSDGLVGFKLDLKSPSDVALWVPESIENLPRSLKTNSNLDDDDVLAFRQACQESPVPHLVQKKGKDTLWFSPDLGPLYWKTKHGAEWILVCAEVN